MNAVNALYKLNEWMLATAVISAMFMSNCYPVATVLPFGLW